MLERLNQLFDGAPRARWRIMVISGAVIAGWGLIGQCFTAASPAEVQTGATIAGSITFVLQVLAYCFGGSLERQAPVKQSRARLLEPLGAITVTALLAVVAAVSGPVVQAAVLTKRLRSALGENHSELNAAAVTRVLNDARQNGIQLSKKVLDETVQDLKQDEPDAAWKALVALLEYTVNIRADVPRRPSAAGTWIDAQPMAIDNVCGPENYTYGAEAQLAARHGEWITNTDLRDWPDTIHDCKLNLDNADLSDVYLWAVLVSYRGGPLHLENVRFGPCRFDLPSGGNTNVREFVNALIAADRNVLTIDLH